MENLADLEKTEAETLLWRAELQDKESEMSTICFHHKHYYGNVFEQKSKEKKKCIGC